MPEPGRGGLARRPAATSSRHARSTTTPPTYPTPSTDLGSGHPWIQSTSCCTVAGPTRPNPGNNGSPRCGKPDPRRPDQWMVSSIDSSSHGCSTKIEVQLLRHLLPPGAHDRRWSFTCMHVSARRRLRAADRWSPPGQKRS